MSDIYEQKAAPLEDYLGSFQPAKAQTGVLFAINASLWLLWHVTGLPVAVSVFSQTSRLLGSHPASGYP